jgi:hypothetical protein
MQSHVLTYVVSGMRTHAASHTYVVVYETHAASHLVVRRNLSPDTAARDKALEYVLV